MLRSKDEAYLDTMPPEFAGRWVAWNRQQTKLIATGLTFEDAKRAAAATGEYSVLLGKVPERGNRSKRTLRMVAVFIACGGAGAMPQPSNWAGAAAVPGPFAGEPFLPSCGLA